MAFGCWISPEGKLFDVTFSSHIKFVLKHPHYFGKTEEEYREIYAYYKEKWECEGSAREEIITDAILNYGWIRARKYLRPEIFSINVNDLNDKNKHLVALFAEGLKDGKYGFEESPYTGFRISYPNSCGKIIIVTIEDAIGWKDNSSRIKVVEKIDEQEQMESKKNHNDID